MQTNNRAIVATLVALVLLIVKNFIPSISNEIDALQSPLIDFISALLMLYAGVQTYVPGQTVSK